MLPNTKNNICSYTYNNSNSVLCLCHTYFIKGRKRKKTCVFLPIVCFIGCIMNRINAPLKNNILKISHHPPPSLQLNKYRRTSPSTLDGDRRKLSEIAGVYATFQIVTILSYEQL